MKFKSVNISVNTNKKPTAIPCTGDCASCLGCWSLAVGGSVVFKKH